MLKRIAHRHIRSLVKAGGLLVRVDYANCDRAECDEGILRQMELYEGSKGKRKCFDLIADSFHRSRVMADVYAQTGDDDDGTGGYMISVFRAR